MIEYDADLEEIAFSADAEALKAAAGIVISGETIHAGLGFEAFFRAGQDHPDQDCRWIAWHGDQETALLFFGPRDEIHRLVKSIDGRVDM